jgi:hypothetical protein
MRIVGASSGYICLCFDDPNQSAFTTGGHPGRTFDCVCVAGTSLRDLNMDEDEMRADSSNDLSGTAVSQNGTHYSAQFTRPLAARTSGQDATIRTNAPTRVVWAIHPTNRVLGTSRHPRGSGGGEQNAGQVSVAFGGSSQCEVMQALNSFKSGPGDFEVSYNLRANDPTVMDFVMKAKTATGWLSFGWSEGNRPAHQSADMYMGAVQNGQCVVSDRWSTTKSQPQADAAQSIVGTPTCQSTGGFTTVSFSRKLDTGDALTDLVIRNQVVLLQWAYHDSNSAFSATHTATGTGAVNLLSTPAPPGVTTVAPTLPPTPAPTPAPPPVTTPTSVSVDSGNFKLSWNVAGADITFVIEAKANGYVSIGWAAPPAPAAHKASDMLVAWFDEATGKGEYLDTYSKVKSRPPSDAQQDGALVAASQANGVTRIEIKRKLNTGETTADVAITNQDLLLQWAYHTTDTFLDGDAHARAGSLLVNFLSSQQPTQPPTTAPTTLPPGVTTPPPLTVATPPPGVAAKPNQFIGADGKLRVSWLVEGPSIRFEMQCATLGYCGIGIAVNPSGKSHIATDMYVGWVDGAGLPHLLDTYSTMVDKPVTDAQQDIETITGVEDGGLTTVSFTRPLISRDKAQDVDIINGMMSLQWCMHAADTYEDGEFHDMAGAVQVNFLNANMAPVVQVTTILLQTADTGTNALGVSGSGTLTPDATPEGGLGTVEIVLIVLGALCFVAIIAAVVNLLFLRRRKAAGNKA